MATNEEKYYRFSKVIIPVEFDLSSFSKNLKKTFESDTKAMVTKTMESREQGMDEITSKHSAKYKEIQNELKVEMNSLFIKEFRKYIKRKISKKVRSTVLKLQKNITTIPLSNLKTSENVSDFLEFKNDGTAKLVWLYKYLKDGFGHGKKRIPSSQLETGTAPIKDHKGKEFITMFPSHDDTSKYALAVQLIITADIPTQVNIYSAYPGVNQTVNITSGVAYVNLPLHITMILIGRTSTSILIRSDQPISVVCYSAYGGHEPWRSPGYKCSSYAFNVLPVNSLGKSYNPLMYEYPSIHIAIVATAPYTKVWIGPLETDFKIVDTTIKALTNGTFTLGYLEGLHLETNDYRYLANVQANNSILLLSGNSKIAHDDESMYACMLPNNLWGQYFVVPIIAKVTYVFLLITTRSFNTTINIDENVRFSETILIQPGNSLSIQLSPYVHTVISSQPVLVTLFCRSRNGIFMTSLSSTSHFSHNYVVAPPRVLNKHLENYISIIIRSSQASGLRFVGNVLSIRKSEIALNNETYSSIVMSMPANTVIKVNHITDNVLFGVTVYGFGPYEAYGFSAGLGI
ncbi:Hypothetical predicted protein [Mytilus galloprovincialis]|uniref:IgGFc-binding protein N-terminal domain-containing protein n=1 Tax=Mytilus galloprovincialis TaxID=29158 RepID=A0A8B6GFF0_MYTGA|nr:Hypothetical predicted protein [Mytilus galloprovincialis]